MPLRLLKRRDFRSNRAVDEGYTLVAIAVGMAVLAILIMGVAPSIATIMKREREQELIFRGKQYARAIAIFQKRYGRLPNELKELYENRPRTIRKLWKEPICNCPDWHIIYLNSPEGTVVGPQGSGLPGGGASPQPTPTAGVFGPTGETKSVGPIKGVRSKVHEEALTERRGQKYYDEWLFIMGDADREINVGPGGPLPPGAPQYPTPAPPK